MLWLLACSQHFVVGDTATPGRSVGGGDDSATDTTWTELPLCINEFMADNASSIADETGAFPDWIELHNPGDTEVPLDGFTLTDDPDDPGKHRLVGGLVVPAGGFQVLWADGLPDLGATHLGFALDVTGGDVAIYTPEGVGSVVSYQKLAPDFSAARVPDCCEGDGCFSFDFRGSPGESNVDPVFETVDLVPVGSTWRYWDLGTNPGSGWETAGFDDSAWASGPGPLGYGDGHQVTTVSYGGVDTAKYITTWFRLTFDAPPRALDSLTLALLRDDGARVYLNGVEVVRDNLPEGDLTDTTLSTSSVGSADETAYWSYSLDPAGVETGSNTLAVEVHQSAADSSDLGFDIELSAEIRVK